jgi:hypothetical protein
VSSGCGWPSPAQWLTNYRELESILKSYSFLSLSRNTSTFTEPKGSLPWSQQPATCLHPELGFFKTHFNIILPSTPTSSRQSLHVFPPKPHIMSHALPLSYSSCLSHMWGEGGQYKPWSSSLCNRLQSPVTSSLKDPNVFLSTLQEHDAQNIFTVDIQLHQHTFAKMLTYHKFDYKISILICKQQKPLNEWKHSLMKV